MSCLLHSCVDPDFEFDDDDAGAKDSVKKILEPPVVDRLWPNCLHRPIRNPSLVDVEYFAHKLKKAPAKIDVGISGKALTKSVASRTRSKQATNPIVKSSQSV